MAEKNEINSDLHYLKLLSIFHYVVGGMMYLFGCIPILHLIMGLIVIFVPKQSNNAEEFPAVFVGCLFIVIALVWMTAAWTLATLVVITGLKLAKKKSYMFCIVIAGVECLFMPFGTVLGVFTIILLSRPSVKELFNSSQILDQKSGE